MPWVFLPSSSTNETIEAASFQRDWFPDHADLTRRSALLVRLLLADLDPLDVKVHREHNTKLVGRDFVWQILAIVIAM